MAARIEGFEDWRYQRFGAPATDGQRSSMYSGVDLENKGLVRPGIHLGLVRIDDAVNNKGETRSWDVHPVVWPPSPREGDQVITLFVPRDKVATD